VNRTRVAWPSWICAIAVAAVVVMTAAAQPAIPNRRSSPVLPDPPYRYDDGTLPAHFTERGGPESIAAADNTPDHNPTTDAGATLGRVLFYDIRLSANDSVSCGSCHQQRDGFSDRRRHSVGFDGQPTRRHSMSLTNARYYARGRFFWDERAATLEAQVLAPIQDAVEMGMSLPALETKLAGVGYYHRLFEQTFGSPTVTADRVARALAQFVRSLVSYRSPYDRARAAGATGSNAFAAELPELSRLGHRLFVAVPGQGARAAGCARCHVSDAQISLSPRNIGLSGFDPTGGGDQGAVDGQFKAPSLRNVAVRAPYMHDGRFATLREVIDHYNTKVEANPFLDMTLMDRRLAVTGGPVRPVRLDLTEREIDALIAFLGTLTDEAFLVDPAAALKAVTLPTVNVGESPNCRVRYSGRVLGLEARTLLDVAHYASAGAVSFARGLNDTPKIAALLLVGNLVAPSAALMAVGLVMATGGLISARRVAATMSHGVTGMNPGQGFTANAITSALVIGASTLGLPVSTTHVSCGALVGIGTATGQAHWHTIRHILLAWVITLPMAALLAAVAVVVMRVFAE
jgi:cytochrome c peroxidase